MNTRTTLKTLWLATLLLTPVAFAGTVQQKPAAAVDSAAVCVAATSQQTQEVSGRFLEIVEVQRTVLQRLEIDVRQELLQRLQTSQGLSELVRSAAPILGKAVASLGQ